MTDQSPPRSASLVPEGAPFSEEQRAWLNGFFAGFLALETAAAQALSQTEARGALGSVAGALDEPAEVPWHDQTLPLAERMDLAAGRPLADRMMAAMAQQDCGQCGYDCARYAAAIAGGAEARLTLCAPGGKETARTLKALAVELDGAAPAGSAPDDATAPAAAPRDSPVPVRFVGRRRLNAPGSEKETWHVAFDLAGSGLSYRAGDSLGLYPTNDAGLVAAIAAQIGAALDTPVGDTTLAEALRTRRCLGTAPDALFGLIACLSGGVARQTALALARGEDPDGDAATLDVLAALAKFPAARPSAEALLDTLEPLQPRLYSISSSPRAVADGVSLTVDTVRYAMGDRQRLGCASTFLAERIADGATFPAYIQPAHGFALPADPATPVIMVGPGTGIAPFRAFLQERAATGASGRNWLFFGHQREATDFFYREELAAMQTSGVLTRLSLAWSRDGAKTYVQDRMREAGAELWEWLSGGAHFYICGDAKRMAKDVEATLVAVAAEHGGHTPEDAARYIADLKRAGRYSQDVY